MINPLNAKDVYIRPERRVPDTKDVYNYTFYIRLCFLLLGHLNVFTMVI